MRQAGLHSDSLIYPHGADTARVKSIADIVLARVAAPAVSKQFTAPPHGSAFTILACRHAALDPWRESETVAETWCAMIRPAP